MEIPANMRRLLGPSILALLLLANCRPREQTVRNQPSKAKKVRQLRLAPAAPQNKGGAVTGNFFITQPSQDECWDVNSGDVGSFNARIHPVKPCHGVINNVLTISQAGDGSYRIQTQFATNSWVKTNGGPGEDLVASSGSDQDPVPSSVWFLDVISQSGDTITTYFRSYVQAQADDGTWITLCADRATDEEDKIQSYFCNGGDTQKWVLVRRP